MSQFPQRHAISRAQFFLELAKKCSAEQRNEFEAYLEAAIIFARAALHRLQSEYEKHPSWKNWWSSLLSDSAVQFFRDERNYILKEGPPKIGQIVRLGGEIPCTATELYYIENPEVPAVVTVERHLASIKNLILQAQSLFT